MAVGAGAQTRTLYARRARRVWGILALSMTLFLALCAVGAKSSYTYLESITRSKDARLQLVSGSQLSVVRHGRLDSDREVVSKETVLNENDEVYTGRDTEANMSLFDGSTVRLSFNTHIKLDSLRTGRFFSNRKEIGLRIDSGTAVLSTADRAGYSSASYLINTPHALIKVDPNSTVRVRISGEETPGSTEISVTADSGGSATVTSGGKSIPVGPRNMTTARLSTGPTDPQPDEQELIRNGDFTEPPTSYAEGPETGLNTAAWLPILERPGDDSATGVVTVTTEYNKRIALINREAQGDRYARLGLLQAVDTSASYFRIIELSATVKVVAQTETDPLGGPQGDVFPLTIKVRFTDSSGKPQEWRHSFYVCPAGFGKCELENASDVHLGAAEPVKFLLKGLGDSSPTNKVEPSLNLDISAVNSIEIYSIGNTFQSWITDISLKAR